MSTIAATTVVIPELWVPIVALFIPVFTAVVTRYRADSRLLQALVAVIASGVLAVISAVTDDVPGDTVQSLAIAFLTVFIPQLAAYIGFWQPVVQVNERLAPTKGI